MLSTWYRYAINTRSVHYQYIIRMPCCAHLNYECAIDVPRTSYSYISMHYRCAIGMLRIRYECEVYMLSMSMCRRCSINHDWVINKLFLCYYYQSTCLLSIFYRQVINFLSQCNRYAINMLSPCFCNYETRYRRCPLQPDAINMLAINVL